MTGSGADFKVVFNNAQVNAGAEASGGLRLYGRTGLGEEKFLLVDSCGSQQDRLHPAEEPIRSRSFRAAEGFQGLALVRNALGGAIPQRDHAEERFPWVPLDGTSAAAKGQRRPQVLSPSICALRTRRSP